MIIDFSAHYISTSVDKMMEKHYTLRKRFTHPRQSADPEIRLGQMEKYGIDMQALIPRNVIGAGFTSLTHEDVAQLYKVANNDNYALCKTYPDKFINICIFSLFDVDSAIKELDRSINDLDCRGVTIVTNHDQKPLDSPEYFPFYEKVAEHDLPIFLHPTDWGSYPLVDNDNGWRMMHVFGWPFDTTQAVWRLIFGGVMDRYPSLKIVTHHLGAMFPYFSKRVEINIDIFLRDKLPRQISEYWDNIYGDTAMDGTVAAFPCGYAFFGSDRMVFGTDYPMGPENGEFFIRENLAGVKAMDIPAEYLEKILSGNAKRLLKIN